MTKSELCAIISKTFALFYALKAFSVLMMSFLPLLFYPDTRTFEPHIMALFASNLIGFALLACPFWFGSEKLGTLIAGKNHDKNISMISAENLLTCVFVGFGCLLFSFAIPDIAELISLAFHDEMVSKIKIQNINIVEKSVTIGLYVILSLIFILGANGLQRSVSLLRQMDIKNKSDN